MGNKTGVLVVTLIVIILVLLSIIVYSFVVQPAISNYQLENQNQGAQLAVEFITQTALQCQTIPIEVGENQTINLIAIECLQAPQ